MTPTAIDSTESKVLSVESKTQDATKTQDFAELAATVSEATRIYRNEPLAKRTTLRVGGPADCFLEPATEGDLSAALRFCREQEVPFFVLGRGSNLVVRDGGFRGVVISLAHPQFSAVEIDGERLCCGAGARLKQVAVEAKRAGLSGLEFLEGIPGSVGGALRMNAGAMGSETFNVLESVRVLDREGLAHDLSRAEVQAHYRCCPLLKERVAVRAVFKGVASTREEIEQRMNRFSRKRWDSQPAAPSAGCMFKNPAIIPAGKLIEELGLKGTRVGGAMVSLEHGNFLVNIGSASARDVLNLITRVREHVLMERGVELHAEIEVIGED